MAESGTINFNISSGNTASNKFDSSSRRKAEYVEHEHKMQYSTATDATTVAAVTKTLGAVHYAGEVVEVSVTPITAPTGGNLAFTVDIKRSTGAGAFASILTGVLTIDSGSVDRTAEYCTLSGTPALARGDLLQVVIAVSGSTGTQGAGVDVSIRIREAPAS